MTILKCHVSAGHDNDGVESGLPTELWFNHVVNVAGTRCAVERVETTWPIRHGAQIP